MRSSVVIRSPLIAVTALLLVSSAVFALGSDAAWAATTEPAAQWKIHGGCSGGGNCGGLGPTNTLAFLVTLSNRVLKFG